jgi:VCBS repeat-containing protein
MRSSRTRMLLLLIVVAGLAGAAVWILRGGPPRPVRVAGKTVGQNGQPLADVRVTLEVAPNDAEEEGAVERAETLSDARGEFAIDYQGQWRRASYRLEARKAGYRDLSIGSAETLKDPVILKLAPATP